MRDKPLAYIETSVISYFTARPSRDVTVSARQLWTREWWDASADRMRLVISDLVIEEALRGDPDAAARRIACLRGIERVGIGDDAQQLAARLIELGALPATEAEDALHVAIATLSGAHYLVTWNFAHLVGPDAKMRLIDAVRACGHAPALLTTPEELLEEWQ